MPTELWDYSEHAGYYSARPNYADALISELVAFVGARRNHGYLVADVGAGTGNLTVILLARGLRCVAVEPNAAMRRIGTARTRGQNVHWVIGHGEQTGLADESVDWVVMGSSFNTMDRQQALLECDRILRPRGFFTCMWNHRDLDDPFQKEIESLIQSYLPTYSRGSRREDQTLTIRKSGAFEDVSYHEARQLVTQTPQQYVDAWRSTRTLKAQAGPGRFETIIAAIERRVKAHGEVSTVYTTRSWTAPKQP